MRALPFILTIILVGAMGCTSGFSGPTIKSCKNNLAKCWITKGEGSVIEIVGGDNTIHKDGRIETSGAEVIRVLDGDGILTDASSDGQSEVAIEALKTSREVIKRVPIAP